MIQTVLGVFLILLHIVCCVLVWLGIKTHLLKVKKYLMALVIFVPFWGTVCVLLFAFANADQKRQWDRTGSGKASCK